MLVIVADHNLVCTKEKVQQMSNENLLAVNPLAWAGPSQCTDSPIVTSQNGLSAPHSEASVLDHLVSRPKKQATRRPSKRIFTGPECNQPNVKVEKP